MQDIQKFKTLATCKPSEFLRQTNRIRKSAEKWLKLTQLLRIREEKPDGLKTIPPDASADEMDEIMEHNNRLLQEQSKKNISKMLDAILESNPDETLEILALCCFVEPEDVDKYPVSMYLGAFNDIMSDEAVIGFFTSLIKLAQKTS